MKFVTYQEAMDHVFATEALRDYSTEKVRLCAEKLGNPQNAYKVIHITGTNGKGSTSTMCFSVLKAWGKRVGIFTSPHLLDIRERFRTDRGLISDSDFLDIVNVLVEMDVPLSYFEYCTLIAFEYFKRSGCEYAVIEVGMGGLLDSTNIVHPEVTAITSIGYDHVDFLGPTLDDIAFQKAGIIKSEKPIIINFHNEVIEFIAQERKAPLVYTEKEISTNLVGQHQRKNAALAYEICSLLGVPEQIILEGLQQVEHPGRLQYLRANLLIDGAHNEQGLESLKTYLTSLESDFEKIVYCFAVKKGKNVRELIVDRFGSESDYILVDYYHPLLEKIEQITQGIEGISYEILHPQEIISLAESHPTTLYVVFGSLYMIGGFYGA